MRKSLILTICLVVMSAAIFYSVHELVSREEEAITVDETVLYGDRMAAEGITVTNRIHCDYHMFWDTAYTVGKALTVRTDYQYSQAEQHGAQTRPSDMQIYSSLNFGMSGTIDFDREEEDEMALEAVRDVAKRTPAGKTHEEEVYLKEYYQFYPLVMDLFHFGDRIKDLNTDLSLSDYFRIPVPPTHKVRVSVTKDRSGQIVSVDQSSIEGDMDIYASSVMTTSGGYCALTAYRENDETVALPEDCSGIHFLPFIEKDGGLEPSIETMRLVYPIDPESTRVLSLLEDSEEKRLLLFTKENNKIMLSVIDRDTMSLQQKTLLAEDAEDLEILEVEQYETFMVPIFSDSSFLMLEENSDRDFQIRFSGSLTECEDINDSLQIYNMAMDYDGSRLAIAAYQPNTVRQKNDEYQYDPSHSTYLMVYDQDGLAYAGKYDQSSDGLLPETRSSKAVRSLDDVPLSVSCN